MDTDITRRGLVAAVAAGATAGGFLGPVRGYLDRFAPLSGGVWDAADRDTPGTVTSPYGTAELRYDDYGVARVSGESEAATYFAVGYAHGRDRLFQMDLQRRQMRGELSAVVGEATLDSDRFYTQVDFAGAAAATWDRIADTEAGPLVEAYCDGVNRARGDHPLPVEFQLLEFEPDPWRPTDVMLAEKQIAWGLTGSFRTLRRATLAGELGADAARQLLPARLDHDDAILGHEGATTGFSPRVDGDGAASVSDPTARGAVGSGGSTDTRPDDADRSAGARSPALDPETERWLSAVEPPPWIGSNSWAVSGEFTDTGAPIVANDPHLTLQAPPVWYEQVLDAPDYRVRGVSFPGVPPVVIGENDHGTWGFTNAGADVIDFYTYETRADGTEYRYGDEWRAFDTEETTIEVADGEDRTVTVRKSVHGAVLDRESDGDELRAPVGLAWTGLTATDTTLAVRDLNRSTGIDDVETALRRFDEPTQNCVYADRDGNVLYRVTGRVPIRYTDGEPVRGDRVFDGSAREGEWRGYTPYGESTWNGDPETTGGDGTGGDTADGELAPAGAVIPYEEMPHVRNPAYVGTANQRIVDDEAYPHYFAEAYGEPFRGQQLWRRLDAVVDRAREDGDSVTPADLRSIQRDVRSRRYDRLRPVIAAAREGLSGEVASAADEILSWDGRVTRDSVGALLFVRFRAHYRDVAVRPVLAERLDDRRDPSEYLPNDWVLAGLPPDAEWFPEGRDAAVREALSRTVAERETEGWETYGDYQRTTVTHPFDRGGLNYEVYPTDGSAATLFNVHDEADAGSSWRQVCPMDERTSQCVLPGGNDGVPFSEHYDDQLKLWADGEFKRMDREHRGPVAVTFEEGSQ
ncbi:penicillin acylase family protein [Halobaculum sp. MBLA0147]|uniref:penicillin acylase family protein n=1 Tax=Halobaculum sp. MBLA0147 TaxID=3079934 RepID=UPI00352447CB